MLERIKRTRDGSFRVNLSAEERQELAAVPPMLRSLVESSGPGDPAYERLFPSAYPDDADKDAAFAEMVHDDLAQGRLASAEVLARTIDAQRLNEDEVAAWLAALNDARLVLGARLGVTEETDPSTVPPDHRQDYGLFRFLGYLVQHLVIAAGGPAERELTWDVVKRMAREKRGEA
jgi:hypothetical protein